MAVESAEDLAAFFDPDEFAQAATYTPSGGSAVDCDVLINRADRDLGGAFDTRTITEGITISARKAQIVAPEEGGIFAVGAESFKIVGSPRLDDADRLIWTCTVRLL